MRKFLGKEIEDFEYGALVIAVMQVLLVAMILVIFFKLFLHDLIFYGIEAVLVLGYLSVLFEWVRKEFGKDFKAYFSFFFVLMLIVQVSWVLFSFGVATSDNITMFFSLIGALIVFLLVFKMVFSRGYTIGKVLLCDDKLAAVETRFDLRAFSHGGRCVVKTDGKYKKGELVKVAVTKRLFKRKPEKVIGREK